MELAQHNENVAKLCQSLQLFVEHASLAQLTGIARCANFRQMVKPSGIAVVLIILLKDSMSWLVTPLACFCFRSHVDLAHGYSSTRAWMITQPGGLLG